MVQIKTLTPISSFQYLVFGRCCAGSEESIGSGGDSMEGGQRMVGGNSGCDIGSETGVFTHIFFLEE